ncbi:MAG: DUF11 domain-containing protein [Rubrobacter sp.]|nr:DUF11 domain-containing protein [Rubrobacter sp.]MDQ3637639.1 DUF11 domain-containing protein [Actinomycetota bacterium]
MTKTGMTKAGYFFGFLLALMLIAGVLAPVRLAWAQVPAADLSIQKFDFPPDRVSVGETLFYELAVANNNLVPGTATNVVVRDFLPSNTRFLFPLLGSDCTNMGNVVTCDLGNLDPGEERIVEFAVCPTEPGTARNTATVSSDATDPNPTNNTAEETTEVTTPAVAGGGCLSQEPQPSPPSGGAPGNGAPGNGAANNGAPEITQEAEQEAESGDIEQSFEVS